MLFASASRKLLGTFDLSLGRERYYYVHADESCSSIGRKHLLNSRTKSKFSVVIGVQRRWALYLGDCDGNSLNVWLVDVVFMRGMDH